MPFFTLDHARQEHTGKMISAVKIDFHHLLQYPVLFVGDVPGNEHAGIIDQDIHIRAMIDDPAATLYSLLLITQIKSLRPYMDSGIFLP